MDNRNNTLNEPTVAALVALGQNVGLPIISEQVHYALVPAGTALHSLKDFQYPFGIPPERIIAAPVFQDAGSFCLYVNQFKGVSTQIFADPNKNTFTAAMDYHKRPSSTSLEIPQFVSHKATLPLRLSEEWNIWHGKHDKLVPQHEFAEFLEDNRMDITKPESAVMLEVAKDLQANTEVNFNSRINTVNGSAILRYDETVNAKVGTGQIEVPETFEINIPVFYGEAPVRIQARLRFRIASGKLNFQFKLYRPAETLAVAFDAARGRIKAGTEIEVLLGSL